MIDDELIELRLVDVVQRPAEGDRPERHVMMLEDSERARFLPIGVGPGEAIALILQLEQVERPRPLLPDLTADLFSAAGGRVLEVRIADLVEDTYYAVVMVDGPTGPRSIDARPSDAINLAVRIGAPIRISPSSWDAARRQYAGASMSRDQYVAWREEPGMRRAAEIAADVKDWIERWPSLQHPAVSARG